MDSFLDYLKQGKAAQAAQLIERTLNKKIRTAITEERSTIAAEVYGDEEGGVISESAKNFKPENTDHPLAHELYHSALNDHEHAIKHGYPGGGNLNQWADNYRKKMKGTKKSGHTPTYDEKKAIHGLTHAIDRTKDNYFGRHSYKPSVSYETKHAAASKLLPHVMNLVHGRPHNEGIE